MTGTRKHRSRDPNDVLLASKFSVARYRLAVKDKDTQCLARFLEQRFLERYINPISGEGRHGFAIIAICCLMIESLVSFRRGWNSSEEKGDKVFAEFFKMNAPFAELYPLAKQFYGHVRNGLLHQAETTGGWRIRRDGEPLFNVETRTIEADLFRDEVKAALRSYCNDLRTADWDSAVWVNFQRKVDAICRNAGAR